MENTDKPESTKRMEITGRFKGKEISLSDWLKLILIMTTEKSPSVTAENSPTLVKV